MAHAPDLLSDNAIPDRQHQHDVHVPRSISTTNKVLDLEDVFLGLSICINTSKPSLAKEQDGEQVRGQKGRGGQESVKVQHDTKLMGSHSGVKLVLIEEEHKIRLTQSAQFIADGTDLAFDFNIADLGFRPLSTGEMPGSQIRLEVLRTVNPRVTQRDGKALTDDPLHIVNIRVWCTIPFEPLLAGSEIVISIPPSRQYSILVDRLSNLLQESHGAPAARAYQRQNAQTVEIRSADGMSDRADDLVTLGNITLGELVDISIPEVVGGDTSPWNSAYFAGLGSSSSTTNTLSDASSTNASVGSTMDASTSLAHECLGAIFETKTMSQLSSIQSQRAEGQRVAKDQTPHMPYNQAVNRGGFRKVNAERDRWTGANKRVTRGRGHHGYRGARGGRGRGNHGGWGEGAGEGVQHDTSICIPLRNKEPASMFSEPVNRREVSHINSRAVLQRGRHPIRNDRGGVYLGRRNNDDDVLGIDISKRHISHEAFWADKAAETRWKIVAPTTVNTGTRPYSEAVQDATHGSHRNGFAHTGPDNKQRTCQKSQKLPLVYGAPVRTSLLAAESTFAGVLEKTRLIEGLYSKNATFVEVEQAALEKSETMIRGDTSLNPSW